MLSSRSPTDAVFSIPNLETQSFGRDGLFTLRLTPEMIRMKTHDSGWNSALKTGKRLAARTLIIIGSSGLLTADALALTGTINGLANDAEARSNGTVGNAAGNPGLVGGVSGVQSAVVNMFQIPAAILSDPTQQFSAATYGMRTGFMSSFAFNGDLYGIGFSTTSAAVDPTDYYGGSLDAASTLIQDNFITGSTPSYTGVSTSNAALVSYLNNQLNAARESGASTAYVFFRVNPDAYVYWNSYQLGTTEGGGYYIPTLNYTTVTVPRWTSVPLGGGGYVTGLVSDPSGAAIYARTDVGGAFRWVPTGDVAGNGGWVSLSDTLVPFATAGATALHCVESIAVDPSTPNRLYMAVGNPSISSTARGIYGSDNQGASWYLVGASNTFVIQGNGGSRANGERLAVDPNNPNILWYGSTTSGLRKFVKSGGVWTATQIASSSVPFGSTNTGITFVACDANSGSTIVYAGVSDATTGGVYRSTDGGTTWSIVGGATVFNPRRAQLAANGTLYVTAGTAGVAKLPRAGSLSLLSGLPTGQTYHGIAVDPNDATGQKVFVASISSTNISRSADGGSTWTTQTTTFNEGPLTSTNHQRKEPDGLASQTGYWFGTTSSLMVTPGDANELWLGDFFGVTRTRNAQNLGTNPGAWWYTLQKNQEETVVLSLKNAPTGAKLLTGLSDVAGFRYLDTTLRPTGAGGSSMGAANTTSLDFSESDNNVWARSTVATNQSSGSGAVSIDGGLNWTTFGQLAARNVANSATAGWEEFDIGPYLKKQQAAGVTSVTMAVRSSHWLTQNNYLRFSSKEGANPPQLVLNGTGSPLTPTADAMVYAGNASTNFGASTELAAQNYYDQPGYVRWSYLKFDLTGQPAITSAKLRLYRLASADTNSYSTSISSTPTTTWVEGDGGTDNLPASEITWTNKPTNFYSTPSALWMGGGRVAVSASNPTNIVWMGIKNGGNATPMYYSTDRGVTWAAASGGPNSNITGIYTNGSSISPSGQPLTADRGNGNFYAAAFGGAGHVIYRSTNSGATWTQVSTVNNGNSYNMRTPQLVAAPVSSAYPSGGDVWLCDDGTYNGNGGGLWRSVDSAGTWSSLSGIGKVTAVSFGKAASGTGYSVFINGYKAGIKGIYRSDDYGSTWVKLSDPTIKDILSLAGDRQNHGKVFIGTDGRGVFQSQ
ncbi:hypothetical protein RAHE111665_11840 [Rariglobus hedericola]